MSMALGLAFVATKGYTAPEVESTQARAQAFCQQVGDGSRARAKPRRPYSRRSTAGSPRASTPPTSDRPRRSWPHSARHGPPVGS